MPRLYHYVGPPEIAEKARGHPAGTPIDSPSDVIRWARELGQMSRGELLPATFIIDDRGRLLIADRHSEHVACAGGEAVQAAGEVFFAIDGADISVAEISNLSTGYCPEPECWSAVAAALDGAGLPHPVAFTTACQFRRCPDCGQRNLVKDGHFACAVCGAELPARWNFGGLQRSYP